MTTSDNKKDKMPPKDPKKSFPQAAMHNNKFKGPKGGGNIPKIRKSLSGKS